MSLLRQCLPIAELLSAPSVNRYMYAQDQSMELLQILHRKACARDRLKTYLSMNCRKRVTLHASHSVSGILRFTDSLITL